MKTLQEQLAELLNRHSAENNSNTPDFILAEYMLDALAAFEKASKAREKWYGVSLSPGSSSPTTDALAPSRA